jgi:hypothetical protein
MGRNTQKNRSIGLLYANKNTQEKGIALLLCLLMSFVIAFSLMVELLNGRLEEKNIALMRQENQLLYNIENHMLNWIKNSDGYKHSLFSVNTPNYYPEQLLQKNIVGYMEQKNNIQMNAITEDLGFLPCMKIQTEKVLQDVHFYRMSVLGENSSGLFYLLQTVFAVPEINTLDTCPDKLFKKIQAGKQSWRIFAKDEY